MMHAAIALALWMASLPIAAWQGRAGRIERRDYWALLTAAGLAGLVSALLAVLALISADAAPGSAIALASML